jgi:hypothetical protein
MTSEQIKARLIFVVACALSLTFVVATMSLIYGLLFVTQPLDVSTVALIPYWLACWPAQREWLKR